MTRWLRTTWRAEDPGRRCKAFSEANWRRCEAVTQMTISSRGPGSMLGPPTSPTTRWRWERDYRGSKSSHGGAVFGSLTAVALLPDRDVGMFIAVNSGEGEIVRGLMYELLDHYLGLPAGQWPEKLHAWKINQLNEAAKTVTAQTTKPAGVGPSLALDRYTGDFADPWYGTIQVRRSGKGLTIDFPHSTGMDGPLTHYQYDTFRTNPTISWVEPAYVTFSLDADGKVERVR